MNATVTDALTVTFTVTITVTVQHHLAQQPR